MRHLSLKWKLTLLYTVCMILVVCVAMSVLFSLSSREVLSSVQMNLRNRVQKSLDDVEVLDGEMDIDSDFYSLDRGIYLAIYRTDGTFLYGRVPYGFDEQPKLKDGEVQTIQGGQASWYVLDVYHEYPGYEPVYIRGVTSMTEAEENFRIALRIALILMPLIVALTAFVEYRFVRRTLMPVRKITDTVQEIRAGKDLSKRIGLQRAGGKNRDEILGMADTFDGMLEELEEAFRREKQFTSDVSHELRTPIGVILAQCEATLADGGLSDRQQEEIRLIQKKARDMASMVSHLLVLSRADEGRQRLHLEKLNISELTQMVAEEQKILAQDRGITIETLVQDPIYAWVDETFYIRMMINLISNAICYGKENGHVRVRLTTEGNRVSGCVEDDGIGISKEALPHIFERFYRADESRTGTDHSGLGLSMVQWVIQAHGGEIHVESVPGKGSRFLFSIPMKSEKK